MTHYQVMAEAFTDKDNMAQQNLPDNLTDVPSFVASNMAGYQHFTDPTMIPFNVLTFPSFNCSMPSFDKVVPDKGRTLIGQEYTENTGIIGNKQKFKNLGGIEMEVRVWASSNNNLKDVIEIGYLNNRLVFNTLVGVFTPGEIVSGGTSGATGKVIVVVGTVMFLSNITGEFIIGETITGLTSGATANTVLVPEFLWHQITENSNPLPRGVHEYYFDEWFDTNLNPALSKRLPRLVWVNGYTNGALPAKGSVYSWTGGIAVVTSITATDIVINPATSWRSLGFSEDINGDAFVIVNGVEYQLATPADLDTNSIDVTSTVGISVGDIVTAKIETDESPIPFDVCRQNKGYMFYGNWNDRDLYMSNAFNRDGTLLITQSQALQNDLILVNNAQYTGTGSHVYRVTIDSVVNPPVQEYFANVGDVGGNNAVFFGNHTGLNTDVYELVVDVVATDVVPFLNGVAGASFAMATATPGSPVALGNGISVYFLNAAGTVHVTGSAWFYTIGGQDTFQYQIDNGNPVATGVAITGGAQSLGNGVEIQFVQVNGHTVGDYWDIQANQAITRAWVNFYYTLPVRKPGEGYKYRQPSNFWTMDTQEESIYVNGSYGDWSVVDTILSGDLQSETVSLTPLKQAGSNKVLYPYLTSHMTIGNSDKLVYINTRKELNTLGREQFLDKPQGGYLSDPVKLDFLASSFIGGRIKYNDKKLYVTSPDEGIMHCLDTFKGYWQPPKKFPELGILSIIGDTLIAHSNIRNQTFSVFTNTSDNGQTYDVSMRTAYTAVGGRWKSKASNMSFTEGYIQGNPKLVHTVYQEIEGCGGISPHTIEPIICAIPGNASFGEGSFGSHPNGSDVGIEGSYFQEIYKSYSPQLFWYFLSIGITCTSSNHSYAILSLGMNAMYTLSSNNALTNKSNLMKNKL
jgi:hypothetical protein